MAAAAGRVDCPRIALKQWLATEHGRYVWDRLKLRLPVAGPIVFKATLARFARSFSLASSSGVPLSQGMTVVAQTVDNAYMAARVEQMRDGVERGESISRCATASGVFTPVVLQMIAVVKRLASWTICWSRSPRCTSAKPTTPSKGSQPPSSPSC